MAGINSKPRGLATRPAPSERSCRREAAALRKVVPRTPSAARRLGRSLVQLGDVLYQQGRYHDAEPVLLEAIAALEQGFGADHLEVATALNNLAVCYKYLARFAEAGPLYQRALRITEHALGKGDPEVAT